MSYADNPEEWHRLKDLYSTMNEGNLLELRVAFDGLTDDAQELLRAELTRRNLWSDTLPVEEVEVEPPPEIDPDDFFAHLQLGGAVVCEYDSPEEAELAWLVLDRAGIRSQVYRNRGVSDLSGPQVMVAPDDLEKAQAILAKGIPEDIRQEFEAMPTSDEFAVPKCPECASEDVMLISVDPTNQWDCGNCGATWQDSLEPADEGKQSLR